MYQNITVVARVGGDPGAMGPAFRDAVREFDPNQPIVNQRTLEAVVAGAVAQPKFRTALIALFAAVALLLAGIGVYGLLAHGVAQRRAEFGVRLALGAAPGQVVGLVVREGLWLAAAGLALGAVGAVFAVRLVQNLLFDVTAWDTLAWGGAGAALVLVSLIASLVPARRSARIPPADALRG
jgi:ABC-type antimicrobial peptide transport system permease subunit